MCILIVALKNNSFYIHSRDDVNALTIGIGSENLLKLETTAVVRGQMHPNFISPKMDYDVAVVKVATPFVVSNVRKPIASVKAGEEPAASEPIVVSGWGINEVSDNPLESFVNRVRVHLQNIKDDLSNQQSIK